MTRTIPQVISIAGKQYGVGLFWQPLPAGRQQLHFIERTARSLIGGAEFYCVKIGGSGQFGLGFAKKGHKSNMPVATISVAVALKDKPSTLAIFKVKEGWWLVVIRNNLILPEDDFLFEKESEARKAFEDLLSLPDWGYKIAPASWGIEATQDMEIAKLLDRVRPVFLQSLAPAKTFLIFGIIVVIGIAGYFLKDVFFPKSIPPQRRRTTQNFMPKKVPSTQTQVEKKSFLKPVQTKAVPVQKAENTGWKELIDFKEYAALCQNGLSYFGQAIPGWSLSEMVCAGSEIKVRYDKREGSLDFFKTAHETYFQQSKMEIQNKGLAVVLKMPMPKLKTRSIKPIMSRDEIEQRVLTFGQKTKQTISLSRPAKTELNDFAVVNFSFSSKIPVRDWASVWVDLGAIRWDEIKWSHTSKSWEAKGTIYAIP